MEIFNSNFSWYKGNLHTHTTRSDGLKGYEEAIEIYSNAGYDFIAVTDHAIWNGKDRKNNMLVLSGIEYDYDDWIPNRTFHVVAVNVDNSIERTLETTPQQLIDSIKKQNGIAFIAHPAWSLMLHEDILNLNGYDGIEIWNSDCEDLTGRGYAGDFVDVIASNDKRFYVFAVDDTHNYYTDLFDGYIMVNSKSLDNDSIADAIRNGRFYASQGPEIRNIEIVENSVVVTTSPLKKLAFMSNTLFCEDRIIKSKNNEITSASYIIKPTDKYIRVEGTDKAGKRCWSQPIWL